MKHGRRLLAAVLGIVVSLGMLAAKPPAAYATGGTTTNLLVGLSRNSASDLTILVDINIDDARFVTASDPVVVEAWTPGTTTQRWSYSSMVTGVNRKAITVPGYGQWRVKVSRGAGYSYQYEEIWVMPLYNRQTRVMSELDELSYSALSQGANFSLFGLPWALIAIKKLEKIANFGATVYAITADDGIGPYPVKAGDNWIEESQPDMFNHTLTTRIMVYTKDAYGNYYSTPIFDHSWTFSYPVFPDA